MPKLEKYVTPRPQLAEGDQTLLVPVEPSHLMDTRKNFAPHSRMRWHPNATISQYMRSNDAECLPSCGQSLQTDARNPAKWTPPSPIHFPKNSGFRTFLRDLVGSIWVPAKKGKLPKQNVTLSEWLISLPGLGPSFLFFLNNACMVKPSS